MTEKQVMGIAELIEQVESSWDPVQDGDVLAVGAEVARIYRNGDERSINLHMVYDESLTASVWKGVSMYTRRKQLPEGYDFALTDVVVTHGAYRTELDGIFIPAERHLVGGRKFVREHPSIMAIDEEDISSFTVLKKGEA